MDKSIEEGILENLKKWIPLKVKHDELAKKIRELTDEMDKAHGEMATLQVVLCSHQRNTIPERFFNIEDKIYKVSRNSIDVVEIHK